LTNIPHFLSISQVKSIINELESNVFKGRKEDPGGGGGGGSEDKENCDSPISWTGSAQIVHQTSRLPSTTTKPADVFSVQVDRVFDREEKRQSRILPPAIDELVSRQNSWSSVDSAVVLGEIARELPSRHSSWGSGDNRTCPSRNSSWGSYDIKKNSVFPYEKDDIPWHPGTVKRTKQKIEERNSTTEASGTSTKRICCDKTGKKADPAKKGRSCSEELLSISRRSDGSVQLFSRLSASAPGSFTFGEFQATECKTAPTVCRRFSFKYADKSNIKEEEEDNAASVRAGIVKNLKMNFEAKAATETETKKGRSLPSSPVAIHVEVKDVKADTLEDINVKGLVKEYEVTKMRSNTIGGSVRSTTTTPAAVVKPRPKSVYVEPVKYAQNNKPMMINHSTIIGKQDEFARPPIPMVRGIVLPTTTPSAGAVTGVKKVQQHGKTHPLARISLAKRVNSAFNTM
jgi:protein phosphatase slingshot